MRIHAIHHVPFEGPGLVADWAAERGHSWSSTWQHAGDALPDLDAVDALLVTGGPMSVGDEKDFPWLRPEKERIAEALRRGIPTLGICLGAQLIAEVLGAKVAPMGHKEIGWYPLRRCADFSQVPWMPDLPEPLLALHWHGDQFEIPAAATRLWESDLCPHQSFVCGSALALQFHLELGHAHLKTLIDHARHELEPGGPGIQNEARMLSRTEAFQAARLVLYRVLDGFWGFGGGLNGACMYLRAFVVGFTPDFRQDARSGTRKELTKWTRTRFSEKPLPKPVSNRSPPIWPCRRPCSTSGARPRGRTPAGPTTRWTGCSSSANSPATTRRSYGSANR